jgi:copper chaperone CopZ
MYELTIPAMSCGHCQKTITAAVRELDSGAKLSFDMTAHKITLDTAADLSAIKQALDAAGYPAQQAGYSSRP